MTTTAAAIAEVFRLGRRLGRLSHRRRPVSAASPACRTRRPPPMPPRLVDASVLRGHELASARASIWASSSASVAEECAERTPACGPSASSVSAGSFRDGMDHLPFHTVGESHVITAMQGSRRRRGNSRLFSERGEFSDQVWKVNEFSYQLWQINVVRFIVVAVAALLGLGLCAAPPAAAEPSMLRLPRLHAGHPAACCARCAVRPHHLFCVRDR